MRKQIQSYIAECSICQKNKSSTSLPASLLQPLPIPHQVWEDIAMDFIDGLPTSFGINSILVVIDRLSKYAHFLPLSHPYSAKVIVDKFVEGVVKLHGMPRSIISDRDPIFMSNFWREFFKLSGTQLNMSSSYHPEIDGQSEVTNRCLEQYLRCFASQQLRRWSIFLPWAEYWYNTSFHISIGVTPYRAFYGRPPPSVPRYEVGHSLFHEVDQMLASRDEILQELKIHLSRAANYMKQVADSKRRDVEFQVGDLVYLKLKPYRQQSVFRRASHKLSSRFYGPYLVEEKIGKLAYKLQLPTGSRIHPVFYVSLLKKHVGPDVPVSADFPYFSADGDVVLEPKTILKTRLIQSGSTFVRESLV
ncbi:hypothetical protein MANES_14G117021v8 [Manihot esculenta]|uniref:Uncharacterized protein n=1 Tax=Manihot esculenta TaxID=3983 RepID=A0ACB7GKQ8_MANES|nr:hypothetical protein MANES_14G117021v8 [Manihot esculenta]